MKKHQKLRLRALVGFLILTSVVIGCLPFTAHAAGNESRFRYGELTLCPGGNAFGVRFATRGVVIVGISPLASGGKNVSPGAEAGLLEKDIILKIDGETVDSIRDVSAKIEGSGGKALAFEIERGGRSVSLTLTPVKEDGANTYRAGLWLRDSTAGIGTVTYVDPESGFFGGLGHGICDADTGMLMPLKRGSVISVAIDGVVKGEAGKPGEIRGFFLAERNGSVWRNTEAGLFGAYASVPESLGEALPVASRYEVREGEAEILCTLGNDGVGRYRVALSRIDRSGSDNKNFVVTVTDEALIARTGGIVQGMSGSPILQDGKLVGAVTHVMIRDPKKGYGIFIENMLDAAASLSDAA